MFSGPAQVGRDDAVLYTFADQRHMLNFPLAISVLTSGRAW